MGKTYRTMQGRQIDMGKLQAQNELMPAVGNIKVNARGDELGPGGKIVRTREQIMAEYYEQNPNAVPDPAKTQKDQPTDVKPNPVPTQTMKIEDTKIEDVVVKEPEMQEESLAKVEERIAEKTVEAVQRARKRRGIKDATGEK
jgi:hypothetical protein